MKQQKYDGSVQKKILVGMIVNSSVLGRLHPKWKKEGLFKDRWSNLVAKWCCDYYEKHGKAPRKSIETIFQAWAAKNKDKSTIELVETFLTGLDGEYAAHAKELNADYVVDLAGKHFLECEAAKTILEASADLEVGEVNKAVQKLESFNRFELGAGEGIDVFNDQEAIKRAFEYKREPLIQYPGALGEFFGDELARDVFIGIFGPYKRGKSYWLQDFAIRGACQRRRVAYFQVGDMSESQVMQRIAMRTARLPRKPCTVKWPVKISRGDEDGPYATVDHEERPFDKGVSWGAAWKSFQKLTKSKIKSDEPYLKLSVHPNSTLSVKGMASILRNWERQGWVADIVVIDYVDILDLNCFGTMDPRDKHNETWKFLRSLSQQLHCLIITATQTKASGIHADTLDESHFSEDARKLGHVNAMLGLNQNKEEKAAGVYRLKWINVRDGEIGRPVYVASCLSLGHPCVLSTW